MGILRADTGGYHRLLASLGVIVVALALIGPWLLMRELDPLTIERTKIDALTPRARAILLDRQDRIGWVQDTMPFWVPFLVLVGGSLVFLGAKGLKELQPYEVREAKARVQQAEALIAPQSSDDREQKALQEVADEAVVELPEAVEGVSHPEETPPKEAASGAMAGEAEGSMQERAAPEAARRKETAAAVARITASTRERAEQRRRLEEKVLDRLEGVPWHTWRFSRRVRVSSPGSSAPILIDGLLTGLNSGYQDWIVEITEYSATVYRLGLQPVTDRLLANTARYEAYTARIAQPWLIVLVHGGEDLRKVEREYMKRLVSGLVTAVPTGDLGQLDKAARLLR